MPSITALSIIEKAQTVLQDSGAVRWTSAELLSWLNEAQRVVYTARKDASAAITTVTLVSGTRQQMPTAAELLLDAPRNLTAAGAAGRALRKVSMPLLDAQSPDWHTHRASAVIREYMYDDRMPKVFFVYPPATTDARLEIKYSTPPAEAATTASIISVDDVYQTVLLDWMLFRALSKETEVALRDRAVAYRMAVEQMLGLKAAADASSSAERVDA